MSTPRFTPEQIAERKRAWKHGDRIRLVTQGGLKLLPGSAPAVIPPGTTGTVDLVDSLGTIHVIWDALIDQSGRTVTRKRYGVDERDTIEPA